MLAEEQSLEDVVEDPESGESETANEVEVSEKALKFKISTESSIQHQGSTTTGGRRSYPGSRKGSRERVHQHLNSVELAKMMKNKEKLRTPAFSFDHHCMLLSSAGGDNKKLSFDHNTPEFLMKEYAAIHLERRQLLLSSPVDYDLNDDHQNNIKCVNVLNNSNDSDEVLLLTMSGEEKKCSNKYSEKLKMNDDNNSKEETVADKFKMNDEEKVLTITTSDNLNSILVDKAEIKKINNNSFIINNSESCSKNNRSFFWRFRHFTDKLVGLSAVDNDTKEKINATSTSTHQNISSPSSSHNNNKGMKKISVEEITQERKASTLPKISNKKLTNNNKKSWKYFILNKDKHKLESSCWASDAAVHQLVSESNKNINDMDNQSSSLPSTSSSHLHQFTGISPRIGEYTNRATAPKKNEFNITSLSSSNSNYNTEVQHAKESVIETTTTTGEINVNLI